MLTTSLMTSLLLGIFFITEFGMICPNAHISTLTGNPLVLIFL